jgi:hypothetical protein
MNNSRTVINLKSMPHRHDPVEWSRINMEVRAFNGKWENS